MKYFSPIILTWKPRTWVWCIIISILIIFWAIPLVVLMVIIKPNLQTLIWDNVSYISVGIFIFNYMLSFREGQYIELQDDNIQIKAMNMTVKIKLEQITGIECTPTRLASRVKIYHGNHITYFFKIDQHLLLNNYVRLFPDRSEYEERFTTLYQILHSLVDKSV